MYKRKYDLLSSHHRSNTENIHVLVGDAPKTKVVRVDIAPSLAQNIWLTANTCLKSANNVFSTIQTCSLQLKQKWVLKLTNIMSANEAKPYVKLNVLGKISSVYTADEKKKEKKKKKKSLNLLSLRQVANR